MLSCFANLKASSQSLWINSNGDTAFLYEINEARLLVKAAVRSLQLEKDIVLIENQLKETQSKALRLTERVVDMSEKATFNKRMFEAEEVKNEAFTMELNNAESCCRSKQRKNKTLKVVAIVAPIVCAGLAAYAGYKVYDWKR